MPTIQISDHELHTILAALRYYQESCQCVAANRSEWIEDLATNGGEVTALDTASIDDLCDRLNV